LRRKGDGVTTSDRGIHAVAATLLEARQPLRGFFGSLLQRFRPPTGESVWKLPTGTSVEQVGPRRTDAFLVWVEDDRTVLDESAIRSRWPASQRVQVLGRNLFLVTG
jgi:hypothetical protein